VLAVVSVLVVGYLFYREVAPSAHHTTSSVSRPERVPSADPATVARGVAAAKLADYAGGIPVLSFHDISKRPGALTVTPQAFADDVGTLAALGFHTVTLDEFAAYARGEEVALPPRPILLTFDDGDASTLYAVDPALRDHGFQATAFVDAARVRTADRRTATLTSSELGQLRASGRWSFGIGTRRFASIEDGEVRGGIASKMLAVDLRDARRAFHRTFGSDAEAIAFPADSDTLFGDPLAAADVPGKLETGVPLVFGDHATRPAIAVAGQPATLIPRLRVDASTSATDLAARLHTDVPILPGPLVASEMTSESGTCAVDGNDIVVQGSAFTRCVPTLNTSLWSNYALRTTIAPLGAQTTAVIGVRSSAAGSVEVLVGLRLVVRHRIGAGEWAVDTTVPLPPAELGRELQISAVGDRLVVTSGTALLSLTGIPPELVRGGVTLAASGAVPAVRYGAPVASPAA
jgi:hypothetical protein